MRDVHGIVIKEAKHGSMAVTLTAFSFQRKFLMKVIASVQAPLSPEKLTKYPFRAELPSHASGVSVRDAKKTIHLTPEFEYYLRKRKVFERIEKQYSVYINVEITFTSALVCTFEGKGDVQQAWTEIRRLQNTVPKVFITVEPSFRKSAELHEYACALEDSSKHIPVDIAIFAETGKGIWVIGDQAMTCIDQIYRQFPELAVVRSTPMTPAKAFETVVMIVNTDVQKYLAHFHSDELSAIASKYDVNIQQKVRDGYAEFILNGKDVKKAEKEIGHLAEMCQQQLRSENVPVTRVVKQKEIEDMNKRFQHSKALLEYNKARRCIHIIADRRTVQHVKEELISSFRP